MANAEISSEAAGRLSRDIDDVCRLLLKPDPTSLEAAVGKLEAAVAELRPWPSQIHTSRVDDGLASDLRRIKAGLKTSRLLLENAAGFHRRRAECLSAVTRGYQSSGAAAPLEAGIGIAVHG